MNKLLEDLKTYGKNISVLYVEDNEDIRSSTLKILQRFFYNIIEAEDGLDGFNKYKSNTNTIDLVITDIGMPKMNGIEMVSEIKKINHNQQILVISAYNNSDYFTQMINLGIDGYLIKPIESKQFLEAILKSVDKIRLQIENTAYQEELVNKNMQLKELNDSLEIKVKQRTVELENKLYIDDLTGLRSRF
ncbi:MAG: response regulator, partial [Sulfurimonas sp.]|nr:response regulator [Sulfurimonas sp.]